MKNNFLSMFWASFLLFFLYATFDMFTPVTTDNKSIEVEVPKGSSFRQTVETLHGHKLIRDKKMFLLIGRLTGAERRIRAGFYSLWSSMKPAEILGILRRGKIVEYEVKILEGDSLLEIAEAFEKAGIIDEEDFMNLAQDPDFLALYEIESPSIEGYLFPDTYLIPKGMKAEDALGIMISRMNEKFNNKLIERARELKMSKNKVLTLASIIEKEAVIDSERPIISAVYHNRLKRNIMLQADPTAIYGIKSSKVKITRTDLQRKTPYNTYVIKGLPPGPIASPGLKSITAALYPEDVQYIYFVAQDDRSHRFSVSSAEHETAVKQYRQLQMEKRNSAKENKNGKVQP